MIRFIKVNYYIIIIIIIIIIIMAKCCPCNGQSARCVRCICVKKNRVCLSCCPLKAGRCQNSMTKTGSCTNLGATVQSSSSCSSASSVRSDNSVDAPSPSLLDSQDNHVSLRSPATTQSAVIVSTSSEIPSLSSIVAVSVFTLRHVPKGVRDHWSSLLTDVLSFVTLNPTDMIQPITLSLRIYPLPEMVLFSWVPLLGLPPSVLRTP